jgi:hypothetical protein
LRVTTVSVGLGVSVGVSDWLCVRARLDACVYLYTYLLTRSDPLARPPSRAPSLSRALPCSPILCLARSRALSRALSRSRARAPWRPARPSRCWATTRGSATPPRRTAT